VRKSFLLPLLLLLFSAAMGLLSPGFFESDELTHFLKARELFYNWHQLLDIWARPACTGLYGLAAAVGGLDAARILAVVITGFVGWGTMQLLAVLPARPEAEVNNYFTRTARGWAWLLLYAQPLFLLNSFTVMTEMLLACAWVWAAVMIWRNRIAAAGFLIGVGALARPEGWFAIACWPVFLMLWKWTAHDRTLSGRSVVAAVFLSVIPTVLWWLAGTLAYQNAAWMIDYFPWQVHSQYGRTGLLFVASSLAALALWMWIPVLAGAASLWRGRHRAAMLLLIVPAAAFFLLHATLGVFGLMGAMSLPRYFICVAPLLAVLGVRGLQSLEARTRRPRLLRKTVITLTILPLLLLLLANQLPIQKSTNERQLDVAIRSFMERGIPRDQWNSRVLASHPYVYYALGIPMDTPFHNRIFHPDTIRDAPAGTYLFTDQVLWNREGLASPEELMQWGYRYDPLVDRDIAHVPMAWDLNSSLFPGAGHMAVGLWVKDL